MSIESGTLVSCIDGAADPFTKLLNVPEWAHVLDTNMVHIVPLVLKWKPKAIYEIGKGIMQLNIARAHLRKVLDADDIL